VSRMSDRLVQSVLAYAQSLLMTSLCAQNVVPSQSNQILTMPIQQLVSQIKVPFAFPSRFATLILPLLDASRVDGWGRQISRSCFLLK